MKIQQLGTIMKAITVEPVLFLYMLIIFMETNALQELIHVKACLQISQPSNISECADKNSTARTEPLQMSVATSWLKYNYICLSGFTTIISLYVASWSDKLGRKFTLIVPPLGTLIASAINCTLAFYLNAHIAYFLVSAAISGITFGSVGVIASSFGHIADITDESRRTLRVVILEAMLFIGGTFGIFIGGQFLKQYNLSIEVNQFVMLFIFEMAVAALITIYVIIRIPNNPPEQVMPFFSCASLFGCNHVKDALKTVFQRRTESKQKNIIFLLSALMLIYIGSGVQTSLSYYYLENRVKWNFHTYSNFNALEFAIKGSALFIALPVVLHFFRIPDHVVALLGMLSRAAGFLLFGLAQNETMVYICAALFIFSEFPVPTIRSMLSKLVDNNEKGRIFAFTSIMQNVCYLLSNLTLLSLYQQTVSFFPGLCFILVATLQVTALAIILYLYIGRSNVITVYETMQNEDGSHEEYQYTRPDTGIN